jgi:hypothetical protein
MRLRCSTQLWELRRGNTDRLVCILVPVESHQYEVLVMNEHGDSIDPEPFRTLRQALDFAAILAAELTRAGWRNAEHHNGFHPTPPEPH